MIRGIIFDLDGVIVSTDEYHYLAWKVIADELRLPFDRVINRKLRGVSRMESLNLLLGQKKAEYSESEKTRLADRKNDIYRNMLKDLTENDLLPGVRKTLQLLKRKGKLLAIGSSSKNTPVILGRIGLAGFFDAVADGNHIRHSKPDPEVFLLAAEKLGLPPGQCLIVEDAEAGVSAALNARMDVLAIGAASTDDRATYQAEDLRQIIWLI